VNLQTRLLSSKPNVRQVLARKQLTNIRLLVLLIGLVLKVGGEIGYRRLLGKDSKFGAVAEGGSEKFHVRIIGVSPDETGDVDITGDAKCPEVYHDRNIFMKARHAREQRIPEPIELGRETNLKFLRRHRERLRERLHLYAVGMLGGRLLSLEDHDSVVSDLLLTEDGSLGAVDDEVTQGIVCTLSILLEGQRVVLE
jgi:hypothetical protein